MPWFLDIAALLNAISQAAPVVEQLFPHAAGGVQADAAVAAKAQLVTALVGAAVPSLTQGQPDAVVAHVQAQLPNVIAAVQMVQAAVAVTNAAPVVS